MNSFLEKIKEKKGVTFIELMITIFIVMFGITGSIALMQRTISYGRTASLRFQAAYLAQEGIELVRNVRDSAWVNDVNWFLGISAGCYIISYNSSNLMPCGETRLNTDIGGFYSHSAGAISPFRRWIDLSVCPEGLPLNRCVEVKSTVSWDGDNSLIIIQRLYNWN